MYICDMCKYVCTYAQTCESSLALLPPLDTAPILRRVFLCLRLRVRVEGKGMGDCSLCL